MANHEKKITLTDKQLLEAYATRVDYKVDER